MGFFLAEKQDCKIFLGGMQKYSKAASRTFQNILDITFCIKECNFSVWGYFQGGFSLAQVNIFLSQVAVGQEW